MQILFFFNFLFLLLHETYKFLERMILILKQFFNIKALLLISLALVFGCQNKHSNKKNFIGVYKGEFIHGNFSTPIQIEIEKLF